MRRRNQLLEDQEEAAWLTTYADLMTLLLVFFVLLFSISSVEKDKFEMVINAFQIELQGSRAANSLVELNVIAPVTTEIPQPDKIDITDTSPEKGEKDDLDKSEEETAQAVPVLSTDLKEWDLMVSGLKQSVEASQLSEHTRIDAPKDGQLKVVVDGSIFFEVGSAQLNKRINPFVNMLLDTLYRHPDYKMSIHGHTDNTPINTAEFPSNWELSAVRATTVLRYLIRGGVEPERLSATGYGDSVPLGPNDTTANRARNRRIEFVLERKQDD